MSRFVEMDDRTTLLAQMEQESGHVILINEFTVEPEDEEQFLKAWAADAAVMKQQPGFISTQLHKGINGSRVFVITRSGNPQRTSSGRSTTPSSRRR